MAPGDEAPLYVWSNAKGLELDMVFVPAGNVFVSRTPVTFAQYLVFVGSTGYEAPPAPPWGVRDNHPVVNVSYDDASAFCQFAGTRLLREKEWELAARGENGRAYPWGDEAPTPELAVYAKHPDFGKKSTAPVGSCPQGASPEGALDLVGNVWVWCDLDQLGRPDRAPLRGGSWADIPTTTARSQFGPKWRMPTLGLRVAVSGSD
jgi:formylglycine-generating enzyme required for sulfatase activity